MLASNLLQGSRVRLTALTSDDLPTIAGWHQNAGFARLFDARPAAPKTIGVLDNWLDEYNRANNGFVFAIRPLGEETLIGYIEIEGIMWAHRHAWLSIAIGDSAHQGRGYGAEALRLALRFAFQELNLHRVQLTVFSYNLRAIALMKSSALCAKVSIASISSAMESATICICMACCAMSGFPKRARMKPPRRQVPAR